MVFSIFDPFRRLRTPKKLAFSAIQVNERDSTVMKMGANVALFQQIRP
jgi:hypothetical protein